MDIVEYNKKRLVIVDKSPINVLMGWTFIGAGLILMIFLFGFGLDKPEYLPFGIFLILAGGLLLFLARETTTATFDEEKRVLQIIRRPIVGKILTEEYELSRISTVQAKEKNPEDERLRFRLELLLDGSSWIPLTRPWQNDAVAFETYPPKIQAFL